MEIVLLIENGLKVFDVIIIGGSFSGLSAALTLGRSLRKTLIIDAEKPCNLKSTSAHNFITHDGENPSEIIRKAKNDISKYDTVEFLTAEVIAVKKLETGFIITDNNELEYLAKKVLFATGVKDIMPNIIGFKDCWGKSILHCPYCHGYEVKNKKTGVLANGEMAFEFAKLINNWTDKLTIYTNGKSELTFTQTASIQSLGIAICEKEILNISHVNGNVKAIIFDDESQEEITALYHRPISEQHCKLLEKLGCILDENRLIKTDDFQKTNIYGVYAAGDNTNLLRSIANASSTGSKAGAFINMELINEKI